MAAAGNHCNGIMGTHPVLVGADGDDIIMEDNLETPPIVADSDIVIMSNIYRNKENPVILVEDERVSSNTDVRGSASETPMIVEDDTIYTNVRRDEQTPAIIVENYFVDSSHHGHKETSVILIKDETVASDGESPVIIDDDAADADEHRSNENGTAYNADSDYDSAVIDTKGCDTTGTNTDPSFQTPSVYYDRGSGTLRDSDLTVIKTDCHSTAGTNTDPNWQMPEPTVYFDYDGDYDKPVFLTKYNTIDAYRSISPNGYVSEKHCEQQIHTCTVCNSMFSSLSSLKYHKKFGCKDAMLSTCEFCGISYVYVFNLRRHQRDKHPEELKKKHSEQLKKNPRACAHCKVTFRSRHALKEHKKNGCIEAMSSTCEICHITLSSVGSLRKHQRFKHPVEVKKTHSVQLRKNPRACAHYQVALPSHCFLKDHRKKHCKKAPSTLSRLHGARRHHKSLHLKEVKYNLRPLKKDSKRVSTPESFMKLTRFENVPRLQSPDEEMLPKQSPDEEMKSPSEEMLQNQSPDEEMLQNQSPAEEMLQNQSPAEEMLQNQSPAEDVSPGPPSSAEVSLPEDVLTVGGEPAHQEAGGYYSSPNGYVSKNHCKQKIYACTLCYAMFSSLSSLKYHNTIGCKDAMSPTCEICGISYIYVSHLQRHQREKHPEKMKKKHSVQLRKNPRACAHCKVTFPSLCSLKEHMKIGCKDAMSSTCEICGISYVHVCNLRRHQRDKHPEELKKKHSEQLKNNPHVCAHCKVTFPSLCSLKEHMKIGCIEAMSSTCEICHITLTSVGSLQMHQRFKHPVEVKKTHSVQLRKNPRACAHYQAMLPSHCFLKDHRRKRCKKAPSTFYWLHGARRHHKSLHLKEVKYNLRPLKKDSKRVKKDSERVKKDSKRVKRDSEQVKNNLRQVKKDSERAKKDSERAKKDFERVKKDSERVKKDSEQVKNYSEQVKNKDSEQANEDSELVKNKDSEQVSLDKQTNSTISFSCTICCAKFTQQQYLERHHEWKHPGKEFSPNEPKPPSRKSVHGNAPCLSCTICHAQFIGLDYLKRHHERKHPEEVFPDTPVDTGKLHLQTTSGKTAPKRKAALSMPESFMKLTRFENVPRLQSPDEEMLPKQSPDEEMKSPAEEMLQNRSPEEEMPQNQSPAEEVLQNQSPAEEMLQNQSPEEEMPQNQSPAEEVLQNQSPEEEMLQNQSPSEEMLQNQSPEEEMLQNQSPAEEMLQNQSPAEEMLQNQSPAEEMLQNQSPAEEMLQNQSPAEDVSPGPASSAEVSLPEDMLTFGGEPAHQEAGGDYSSDEGGEPDKDSLSEDGESTDEYDYEDPVVKAKREPEQDGEDCVAPTKPNERPGKDGGGCGEPMKTKKRSGEDGDDDSAERIKPKKRLSKDGDGFAEALKVKEEPENEGGRKSFLCPECGEVFVSKSSLGYHRTMQHCASSPKPLSFPRCTETAISLDSLQRHMRTHRREKNRPCPAERFNCNKCSASYSAMNGLKRHMKIHTGENYRCKECSKDFQNQSRFYAHKKMVHPEAFPFYCAQCDQTFVTNNKLERHMRTHTVKPFPCSKCKAAFNGAEVLERHMLRHKPGAKKRIHTCPQCPAAFQSRNHLQEHMRKHTGEKPFLCATCGRSFTHSSSYSKHVRLRHGGEKPFQCSVCGEVFLMNCLLKKHVAKRHAGESHVTKHDQSASWEPRPWKYQQCPKAFRSKGLLEAHALVHSDLPPQNICVTCDAKFCSKANLTRHMITHMDRKPYECEVCHQTFTQLGTMRVHMRIHTGHRPYKCSVCDAAFIQCGQLSQHMKKRHSGNGSKSVKSKRQ